ncbi:MAG: ribose 5-phosphate isomerase B [Blastocatellia bacterium]|nr:ribose 5-phosphate isomerase B [Blastocatellia bacterium]
MAEQSFNLTEKTIITEDDLRRIPHGAQILLDQAARLTPLAQDIVAERKLTVHRKRRGDTRVRKIAIGADHGGFSMKEKIKTRLAEQGIETQDFGTFDERPVDYPDIAHAVAVAVSNGTVPLGILLDGAGIGSCMVANKVPGVRAAMCYDVATARNSREHNDANVLTLGAKMVAEATLLEVVDVWLHTQIREERHLLRVEKIKRVEEKYLR